MLWEFCLNQLKHQFSETEVNTWLLTLQPSLFEAKLVLFAPNQMVVEHIQNEYLQAIKELCQQHQNNPDFQVELIIGSINEQAAPTPQPNHSGASQSSTHKPYIADNASKLNEKYNFDNYVLGNSNQLALASSRQVSQNPGAFNPLCIYGGVGLGKTHLLQAVGNAIKSNHPELKVIYIHSEHFVNDMVTALQDKSIDEFKKYYRRADALLIDDIQFFSGKTRSMEEFFHTFNTLLEGQKQVIVTSDMFPRDIDKLDDRLSSRLTMGLTVAIDQPDVETRVAILNKKSAEFGITLPSDASFFIAEHFKTNVRDLEGALRKVAAVVLLQEQKEITIDFVKQILKDQLASFNREVSIEQIKSLVAKHYNLTIKDIDSKSRTRSIVRPRQIAMALAKDLTKFSLPELGANFGGRDHTTIIHACKKIAELRSEDRAFDEDYMNFFNKLN